MESPAQGRDMRPPFRLIVKLRRFSWLPAVWPNLTWITMESPPDTTWRDYLLDTPNYG